MVAIEMFAFRIRILSWSCVQSLATCSWCIWTRRGRWTRTCSGRPRALSVVKNINYCKLLILNWLLTFSTILAISSSVNLPFNVTIIASSIVYYTNTNATLSFPPPPPLLPRPPPPPRSPVSPSPSPTARARPPRSSAWASPWPILPLPRRSPVPCSLSGGGRRGGRR